MIPLNSRIRQLQKKYQKEAQRFLKLTNQIKRTQSFQRLIRYERQLQRLGIAASLSMTLLGIAPQATAQSFQVETLVNTETNLSQRDPSIAVDSDGDFVVVWTSASQDNDGDGVYGQRYNSDGTPNGSEFQVNTETINDQRNPSVAMDADGDFVVVWQTDGQDGDYFGVYGQRYNSDGSTNGSEFPVNTETNNYQGDPSVAMDADGDFVVVWTSYYQDDGSYSGVYGQRYNSDGTPNGSEFLVNTETNNYQSSPSVAIDSDGDFVVVWNSADQDDSGYGVYGQRYNSDGSANGSEFLVNTSYTTGNQSTPSVAIDSDGDFVVVWQSFGQDDDGDGVYGQRYNSDGSTNGSEFPVNTETNDDQSFPSVAIDSDGDFVVVWQSDGQDGIYDDVYGQRYNSDGTTNGSEFLVNTYTTINQNNPSIAIDANGDFVVVWQSRDQDGSNFGVYGQAYKPSQSFKVETLVNTETNDDQRNPSIAVDADGDFVVVWQSDGQDGSSYGVYGQRYNSDGMPNGYEFQINTHTTGRQQDPSIAMDSDGDFVVVWRSEGQDNSGISVHGQRYNSDGTPNGSEFQINTYTTGNQVSPKVAMDSSGDFVVVWRSGVFNGVGQDGDKYGIYGQRYNSDGTPNGSEFLVNTETINDQRDPSVSMDSDGDFVIVWTSYGQDGASGSIHGQRYNSDGTSNGSEFQVNTYTTSGQRDPSVSMDSDGDFVVVWESYYQDDSFFGVHGQYYNGDGTPNDIEFLVNTHTTFNQQDPSIAIDSDGDFVVVWESYFQDGYSYGVYGQRYYSDGTTNGSEFLVNTQTNSDESNPNIAIDSDGDFVVVWESSGQDGSGDGVYGQAYNSDGTLLPVELLNFKGQQVGERVQLTWQTASETNNEGFWIERSENGKNWKPLTFVKGAGTSLAQQNYRFLDEQPLAGISYYRLQQMDFDGQYEYSNIISITQEEKSQALRVYPNPVQGGLLQVVLPSDATGQFLQLELHNSLGQIVEMYRTLASQQMALDLSRLSSGIYTLIVAADGRRWTERVVVE